MSRREGKLQFYSTAWWLWCFPCIAGTQHNQNIHQTVSDGGQTMTQNSNLNLSVLSHIFVTRQRAVAGICKQDLAQPSAYRSLWLQMPTQQGAAPPPCTGQTVLWLSEPNLEKKFSRNLLCLFVFIYFLHYIFHDQYHYLNKNAVCTRASSTPSIPMGHAALKWSQRGRTQFSWGSTRSADLDTATALSHAPCRAQKGKKKRKEKSKAKHPITTSKAFSKNCTQS